MIIFVVVCILVIFVFIKCIAKVTKAADEKIIGAVCEEILSGPNEDLLDPHLDVERLNHILTECYFPYFTEEAFNEFIWLRYGDKYHILANDSGKQIIVKDIDIIKNKQSRTNYSVDVKLEVIDNFSEATPLSIQGNIQMSDHKISHIQFLDNELIEVLAQ